MAVEVGKNAVDFSLMNQDGQKVRLLNYLGKWAVLYFYPKDNTSGCTVEAIEFTNRLPQFEKANVVVFGISPDSIKSHCDFIKDHTLKVNLLSDEKHDVLEKYGVWQLKKLYGDEFYGVVRSTFLIDPKGKIAYSWKNIKPLGHADEVLKKIGELSR